VLALSAFCVITGAVAGLLTTRRFLLDEQVWSGPPPASDVN